MADTTSDLIPLIDRIRSNPIAIQRLMLQRLEEVTSGKVRIVDPTNPFVFLLEASCTNAAVAMMRAEALTRKQYPSVAMTQEDLYIHMSDTDFLNRFASPSKTTISILLDLNEIKEKAVLVPNTNGVKKLTIPRHTEITVADTSFTFQYPIEIKVMPHGGFIVTYDTDYPSPLYRKESNTVEWFATTVQGIQYLRMDVPLTQIKIATYTAQMNAVTGYTKSYNLDGSFYYCRAFIRRNTVVPGRRIQWDEIRTTHSDQVYDPSYPTVLLKVVGKKLTAHVPHLYFTSGKILDTLRLDVYTTKGKMELNLANFEPPAFKANWVDNDDEEAGKYFSPLRTFSGLAIFGTSSVYDGGDEIEFGELRERVITRSLSSVDIPITNAQVETMVEDAGFELVVDIDNITNRQFLATREIDPPTNKSTHGGLGCSIRTLQTTMTNLAAAPTVANNGSRLTIYPNTIFKNVNNVISVVPNTQVLEWVDPAITSLEELTNILNSNDLLFTPFYYVFDASSSEFDVRPYHLDKPEVVVKYFVIENEEAYIQAASIGHEVVKTNAGYELYVQLRPGSGETALVGVEPFQTTSIVDIKGLPVNDVKVQLSYIPPGSTIRKFYEGQLFVISGNYIVKFTLPTDFDIDASHRLMFEDVYPADLTTQFDLAIIALNRPPVPSAIDEFIDAAAYPLATSIVGLAHERFTIKFGDYLENLWVRSRSFVDSLTFDTYPTDVLATYEKDVYERDIDGNIILSWNITTSEYEYNILHWIGEPKLNVAGDAALAAWLLLNPDHPSTLIDWVLSLTNAERQSFITNISNIRVAPNTTDTPVLTGPGTTAYGIWLAANTTTDNRVFDWWDTLNGTQKALYSDIKHNAGDNVLDEFGEPIIAGGGVRGILRQADMLFLDGKYFFSTDPATTSYRQEVITEIRDWVMEEISNFSDNLIEQSEMYFYPKSNVGNIDVVVGDNETATIKAEQFLTVTYQVTEAVHKNHELRAALETATTQTLSDALNVNRVSHSDLIAKLKTVMGDDVISVELDGFVENRHKVITVKNKSMRPTLGKEAVLLSNRTISIRDAVTVTFVKHK
jgi:hypothetical protein